MSETRHSKPLRGRGVILDDEVNMGRILGKTLAMEGLDRHVKWEAEALLGATSLVPRVRTDHPRLFFNARPASLRTGSMLIPSERSETRIVRNMNR